MRQLPQEIAEDMNSKYSDLIAISKTTKNLQNWFVLQINTMNQNVQLVAQPAQLASLAQCRNLLWHFVNLLSNLLCRHRRATAAPAAGAGAVKQNTETNKKACTWLREFLLALAYLLCLALPGSCLAIFTYLFVPLSKGDAVTLFVMSWKQNVTETDVT